MADMTQDMTCSRCPQTASRADLGDRKQLRYWYDVNSSTKFVILQKHEEVCIDCFNKIYEEAFPDTSN